jgi:hypothetical protein
MTLNKQLAALYVLAACIFGCKEPTTDTSSKRNGGPVPPETEDTMTTIPGTIEPIKVASWQSFETFDGKYATETGMLEKEPLKKRISELLGKNNTDFLKRFDVTPPVEVEHDVLYNQGCRRHYCGADEAAIAIDMRHDIIYIGIAINGRVTLFSERNDQGYPEKLLRWKNKFPADKE